MFDNPLSIFHVESFETELMLFGIIMGMALFLLYKLTRLFFTFWLYRS